MPTYEHRCDTCQHEWEAEYSIKVDPPKQCPKCEAETVTRLISGAPKGIVELYGQDLVDKIKADAKKEKAAAAKDEKIYANLLGEDRYQSLQTQMDQRKRERR